MATNCNGVVEITHQRNMMKPTDVNAQGEVVLPPHPMECLSCRIMGTGVMAGAGSYAIWQSRASAPGSPGQKKIVAGLGLALLVGSVFRWRARK